MTGSNRIEKVAIVGASGNVGSYMTDALLKTGKHTVTAITRASSNSTFPSGVHVVKADYDDPDSLVAALKGQDALVITLGAFAPQGTDAKLIHAAAKAGVHWVLPNEWSPDTANEELKRDVHIFGKGEAYKKAIKEMQEGGNDIHFVAVACGFWYEWSLAIPDAYGFNFEKKSVTLFDEGEVKMNTTTWPQVGRAVASVLSLPVKPEDDGKASLEQYRDKLIYVSSFAVSQKDMLESVLRVTKTSKEDWTITSEPSKERYEKAKESMAKGEFSGFVQWMYSRLFFPDGSGLYEKSRGLQNEDLGLPVEDLDEATERAVQRAKEEGEKK